MSSLLTNSAAMTALQTLSGPPTSRWIPRKTGSRPVTVCPMPPTTPPIGPIATTMRSDNKALGAVQDALGLGRRDRGRGWYTALNSTVDVVSEIKGQGHLPPRSPASDRGKIQGEIDELQEPVAEHRSPRPCSTARTRLQFDSTDAGAAADRGDRQLVHTHRYGGGGGGSAVSLETTTVEITGTQLDRYQCRAMPWYLSMRTARGPSPSAGGFGDGYQPGGYRRQCGRPPMATSRRIWKWPWASSMRFSPDITRCRRPISARSRTALALQQDFVFRTEGTPFDRGVGQLVDAGHECRNRPPSAGTPGPAAAWYPRRPLDRQRQQPETSSSLFR